MNLNIYAYVRMYMITYSCNNIIPIKTQTSTDRLLTFEKISQ